jgi:tRNA pseudouridine55 synthase
LGYATETGDFTGRALTPASDAQQVSAESFQAALTHFRGRIQQMPPMYSAKKVSGVRLYAMARRGEEIARQPIEVEIKELELRPTSDEAAGANKLFRDHADGTRDFAFRVVCSAGTYIRTLAADIGARLGIGAHLTQLRRTRAGACVLSRALTLEHLAEVAETEAPLQAAIPMAEALPLPELQVSRAERALIAHGRAINRHGHWIDGERIKLCGGAELIAIAEYDLGAGVLRPRVVLT